MKFPRLFLILLVVGQSCCQVTYAKGPIRSRLDARRETVKPAEPAKDAAPIMTCAACGRTCRCPYCSHFTAAAPCQCCDKCTGGPGCDCGCSACKCNSTPVKGSAAPDVRGAISHSLKAAAALIGADKVREFFERETGEAMGEIGPIPIPSALKTRAQAKVGDRISNLLSQ